MTDQLRDAFYAAFTTARKDEGIPAKLGDGQGNLFPFPDRNDIAWARLQRPSSVTLEKVILGVTAAHGAPVRVRENENGDLEAFKPDPSEAPRFWEQFGKGIVTAHQDTHQFLGPDTLMVDARQLKPLQTRLLETPGLSVYLEPYVYSWGVGQAWNGDEVDLTSYVPTGDGQQRFVIVGLDVSANAPLVFPGSAVTFTYVSGGIPYVPFTLDEVAALAHGHENFLPSMAVRLYSGMTRIERYDLFADCRNWMQLADRKHNYIGTVDPTVDDDETVGYQHGSMWFNVSDANAFICVKATAGAAQWRLVTGGGTGTGGNEFTSLFIQDNAFQYSFQEGGIIWQRFTDVADAGLILQMGRGRGTVGTPAAVQDGDAITDIFFQGRDSSQMRDAAAISVAVDDITGSVVQGGILFKTTDAAGDLIERLGLFNDRVQSLMPFDVVSLTSTERDALTPDNGWLIYNTTTNTFQFRQNGAWVDLGTGGSSAIAVKENGSSIVAAADTLDFKGFNVVDLGSNDAGIYAHATEPGGRLTLTSGTPVTISDVTAAGTLYYTPYRHNLIELNDGTDWLPVVFSETSLSLTLTSGSVYDVFAYLNSGALALETLVWSSATARATDVVYSSGRLIKSGDATRRYLGTIKASGTNTTEDSNANRYVWNNYNPQPRKLKKQDATVNWSYGTAAWQSANASTANRVNFVIGWERSPVYCEVLGNAVLQTNETAAVGIGLDVTNANHADNVPESANSNSSSINVPIRAVYEGFTGIGSHFLQWVEYARSGTVGFIGTGAIHTSGLLGWVWG